MHCGDGGTGGEAWWGGKEKRGAFGSAAVRGMSPEPLRATGTPSVLPKPDVVPGMGTSGTQLMAVQVSEGMN